MLGAWCFCSARPHRACLSPRGFPAEEAVVFFTAVSFVQGKMTLYRYDMFMHSRSRACYRSCCTYSQMEECHEELDALKAIYPSSDLGPRIEAALLSNRGEAIGYCRRISLSLLVLFSSRFVSGGVLPHGTRDLSPFSFLPSIFHFSPCFFFLFRSCCCYYMYWCG